MTYQDAIKRLKELKKQCDTDNLLGLNYTQEYYELLLELTAQTFSIPKDKIEEDVNDC